jgi:putative transposase
MTKTHLRLSEADKIYLLGLQKQTGIRSKVFKRVTVLLELNKGKTIREVMDLVCLSYPTISSLIKRYNSTQLKCLEDKKQPGRPIKIDGYQRAKITALACSKAPEGYATWSLRLLADKIVELNYCESISHSWVDNILKKTILNRI